MSGGAAPRREPGQPLDRLAAALGAGTVNLDQTMVIARALEALPDDLEPALLVEAVIAPEVGEAEEAKQLQREEERAWETTSLALVRRGDGTTRLSGILPDTAAVRLETYLDAFTHPARTGWSSSER